MVLDGPEPQLTVNRGLHTTSTGPKYEKPKSTAGHRTIHLIEIQTTLIKSHLAATADYRNGDPTEPLFMTQKGGSINYSNFRNRYFEPALKVAGISKARIHDLRRTTATMLFANHVDLKTIETMMGHSDARITLGVYISTTESMAKIASETITTLIKLN